MVYYSFVAYFTAGSSRDGEPTMPEALLDNKHEMDDWRHVDTVSFAIKKVLVLMLSTFAGSHCTQLLLSAGQSCPKCLVQCIKKKNTTFKP